MLGKALNSTKGTERADKLPMAKLAVLGAALVGVVSGFDNYETEDTDAEGKATGKKRVVKYVKLTNAVEFQPDAPHSEIGKTVEHLAIGMPINADTKAKLDADTLPVGSYLLVQFREIAAQWNNMRLYRVETLTKQQYNDILRAAAE